MRTSDRSGDGSIFVEFEGSPQRRGQRGGEGREREGGVCKDGGHEEDLRRIEEEREYEEAIGEEEGGSGSGAGVGEKRAMEVARRGGLEGAGFGKAHSQANTVGGGRGRRMSWL